MELIVEYGYLFPASIAIATLAMSTGIGGAVFFSPIFMLGLSLEPVTAVGAALLTELFGFSSGVYAYIRARLIDYGLAANLLVFSIPFAILGSLLADSIPDAFLKGVFGVGIFAISTQLYSAYRNEEKERKTVAQETIEEARDSHERSLTDNEGNTYYYTIKSRWLGRTLASIGSFFLGIISVGLAEILEYRLVAQCRVPAPVAVASSIFVVVITILLASVAHAAHFLSEADQATMAQVGSIVLFTIPGVVVGGQIGPWMQKKLPQNAMKLVIAGVFALVGIFMFVVSLQ